MVIGSCSLLFAKNTKKTVPEKQAVKQAASDYDRKIEEKNAVLDSIKAELQKGREKLTQLQTQEGTVKARLTQLESNIATSESYLREVSVKIDSLSRSVIRLGDQLAVANRELAQRQSVMKKRLRAIYEAGSLRLPQLILTSRNMSDLLHRVRYFNELNRYDRRLAAQIDSTRIRIETGKAAIERQQRRMTQFKHDKESEYGVLVAEQESHRKLLTDVQVQKDVYVKMIRELETAQKELLNIVAMLEKNRKKKAPTAYEKSLNATFEKQKGSLPWPVEGKVVTDFGKVVHSVYKTVTMNTGIDIGSATGAKVCCIASGKVAYVGWMRGLGKLVIVDHGGYYTTYARLEETLVAKDDKVEPGSVIGNVGEINALDGARLHFEIRKSTEAIDPLEWLEKKKK
jgi:septal ring factor EnvC (AmiA/AmiB activator)